MSTTTETVHGSLLSTPVLDRGNCDVALLLSRFALSAVFLFHGSQILFGAFDGPGLNGFATVSHVPKSVGGLIGVAEFGGGLALVLGFLTRIGAVGICVVMLGAILLVHLPNGFNVQNNGVEFPLTLFIVSLGILLSGPGRYSISDRLTGPISRM